MAPQSGIESPFVELKNSSNLSVGYDCETLVAQYLTEKYNFNFISRNQKICNVEVDLLMRDQKSLHLVEVKSLIDYNYIERRVTKKQQQRIRFVLNILLNQNNFARAHLAIVHNGKVDLYLDFFVEN